MTNICKSVIAALAMSGLLVGMPGCQEGPAERAGKKIDKTIEKGGQQLDKAGDKIREDLNGK